MFIPQEFLFKSIEIFLIHVAKVMAQNI